jgi:signal transduction histidine kinase
MQWQVPADLRQRPSVGEWLTSAVLLGWSVVDAATSDTVTGSRLLLAVCLAVAAGSLVYRRRAPLAVLLVASVFVLLPAAPGTHAQFAAPVFILVVAVFSVGRYGRRPKSYLALPIGMAVALVGSASDPQETMASSWGWSLNVVWIFGIGLWLNEADRRVEATQRRAEADRRAAAAEERLRVARDLHDVLAHSLSLMVVQAEVADELFDTDAPAARDAVRNIQRTGREALAETRNVLQALRARDPDGTRGVDDLPRLVELFRSAGLPVSLTRASNVHLTPDAGETVFRMVQEALTNALRHAGPQPTTVVLSQGAHGLTVCVENSPRDGHRPLTEPAPDHGAGGGHGLIGMRERVEACGGRLDAGVRPDGGFRVAALLPLAVARQ